MNLMMVLGILVLWSLWISVCRLTVSNALLMSSAIAMVRCGGCFLLKPVVMVLFMWCSAVVVDLCYLKPCWCSGSEMLSVM